MHACDKRVVVKTINLCPITRFTGYYSIQRKSKHFYVNVVHKQLSRDRNVVTKERLVRRCVTWPHSLQREKRGVSMSPLLCFAIKLEYLCSNLIISVELLLKYILLIL